MYEYQPIIKEEDFTDLHVHSENPQRMTIKLARSFKDRTAINQTNIQFCSVEKLWLDTPGKKGPEDKAVYFPHTPVPADASNRWHFAPKVETIKIGWEIKGRLSADTNTLANPIILKLELFTRNNPQAFWTKTMKWAAGECPKRGETEFNGMLAEDLFKSSVGKTKPTTDVEISTPKNDNFPDGILTVDNSPYKLKLSIVDGGENRLQVAKWIYIDVLVDSLEVNWGDISMLPKRTDIADPENLKKVCGHKKDINIATDKDIKGYEDIILEELKTANQKPIKDVVHEVKLTSNLFAFQKKQAKNTELFQTNTDFTTYKELWGNGMRIPLLVKAYIKTSVDKQKTDKVPEALGKSKILWDWHEKNVDRWKEALSNGHAPKTETFLDNAYKKNNDAKPAALSNCPMEYGGKRGDDSKDAQVFPEQAAGGTFPFVVKNCAIRKWSSLSNFGTGEKRDQSGVIFQPSRMAGDAYMIKAYLHFDRNPDLEADIEAPPPIQTDNFLFKVFRRIQLNSLVRGRAELNTDPTTLETNLKTDYLKELDMVVEVKQFDVNNTFYKAALQTAIQRVCSGEHFVDEIKEIPYLSLFAKYGIEPNPPDDSAGVVFRSWDDISTDLENKFENSAIRIANTLTNGELFIDEEIKGTYSGATGTLFKVAARRFVLYPTGGDFTYDELVEGEATKAIGRLRVTRNAKSCWGHQFPVTPKANNDDKIFKEHIRIIFPNETLDVKYNKRSGFSTELSPDLSDSAKLEIVAAFARAWSTHNESDSFDVEIQARNDSTNARQRSQNLKTYLESFFTQDTIVDRKAVLAEVLKKLKTAFIGGSGQRIQDDLALLLVGEITWEYAARQFPDEEGIFNLHIPGLYKGYLFPDEDSNDATEIKMPKVTGASYPELTGKGNNEPFSTRNRSIVYLGTVLDNVATDTVPTKTVRSIFNHELAHSLFLPHSPSTKRNPIPYPKCHVYEDKCLMNYDLDTEHFCGMCMIRIRGWNWQTDSLKNAIKSVKIQDGNRQTYLPQNARQYVNLPADGKWVDNVNIMNKDRLGRKIKIKVEFQEAVAGQNVFVLLLAHQNNSVYSASEISRNPDLDFLNDPAERAVGDFNRKQRLVQDVTDNEGNFYVEFDLSPAVGDRYTILAWDDYDNRVRSVEITTWRALYYMILRYAHPNSVPTPQITATIDNTFLPNFTKWIFTGEVIDQNNRSFQGDDTSYPQTEEVIRAATNVICPNLPGTKKYPELEPFLARIVLVDMVYGLGSPRIITTTGVTAPVGTGSGTARIQIRSEPDKFENGINYDQRKGLLINQGPNLVDKGQLNPKTPANQYFVSGRVTLPRQSVTTAMVSGNITKSGNARVTITAAGMNNSPKIINVPVSNGDKRDQLVEKILRALSKDRDVTAQFEVREVNGMYLMLTKIAAGAHDGTLNIALADGTCIGLKAEPQSTNTVAGANGPTGISGIEVPIHFASVTPVIADPINRPGGYIEADVRVDNLTYNGRVIPQENGTISLEVYVINKCVAGMARISNSTKGLIFVPAAHDFHVQAAGGQLNSIIHELGHGMGMVANPTEVGIDVHRFHYNSAGDHCSHGLARTIANDGPSYQVQTNEDLPGVCVMFGFTSNVNPRTLFCAECERVMKKIDIRAGLLGKPKVAI